jgi:AcrR family transcriptional regulator
MSYRHHPRTAVRSSRHLEPGHRQLRREELLLAALDAIRRVGPDASMDAMAAEAGITKPILYRYFGDRDGLIAAVADRFADALVTRLEGVLDGPGPAGERTRLAIDSYVGFIEEDPSLYGFLTHHSPVSGPAVQTVVDRVAATLARRLGEDLRAVGSDSAAAESWAYGIVGMVHLAGARWAANPTIPRHRLIEYLTNLTRFGLEGRPTA